MTKKIQVTCPKCSAKWDWPGETASSFYLKPSRFTFAGWLLVLLSAIATVVVAFPIAALASEYEPIGRNQGRFAMLLFVIVVWTPNIIFGVAFFFAGKWIIEKKLNIAVANKSFS